MYVPEDTLQDGVSRQNHIVFLQVIDILGPGTAVENIDFKPVGMLLDLVAPLHDGDSGPLVVAA